MNQKQLVDAGIKEIVWPPNGFLFKEESLTPVFCKPKLIPLKSVTLEKLEKMQAEALEKLKELEKAAAEEAQQESQPTGEPTRTDIWQSEENS